MYRLVVVLFIFSSFLIGCSSGDTTIEATPVHLPTPTQNSFFVNSTRAAETPSASGVGNSDEGDNLPTPVIVDIISTSESTSESIPTNSPTPTVTLTPTPLPLVRILFQLVNMRSGPGTDYDIIVVLREDEVVRVLGLDAEGLWYKVETLDGMQGWVSVSMALPADDLALTAVPIVSTLPAITDTVTPIIETISVTTQPEQEPSP